jgi:hypothetical protein
MIMTTTFADLGVPDDSSPLASPVQYHFDLLSSSIPTRTRLGRFNRLGKTTPSAC